MFTSSSVELRKLRLGLYTLLVRLLVGQQASRLATSPRLPGPLDTHFASIVRRENQLHLQFALWRHFEWRLGLCWCALHDHLDRRATTDDPR